jgi:hypothetical protein
MLRQRGEEMAAGDPDSVLERWDATADTLRDRLRMEPTERMVSVLDAIVVLTLDDYLRTRILELCVCTATTSPSASRSRCHAFLRRP